MVIQDGSSLKASFFLLHKTLNMHLFSHHLRWRAVGLCRSTLRHAAADLHHLALVSPVLPLYGCSSGWPNYSGTKSTPLPREHFKAAPQTSLSPPWVTQSSAEGGTACLIPPWLCPLEL